MLLLLHYSTWIAYQKISICDITTVLSKVLELSKKHYFFIYDVRMLIYIHFEFFNPLLEVIHHINRSNALFLGQNLFMLFVFSHI